MALDADTVKCFRGHSLSDVGQLIRSEPAVCEYESEHGRHVGPNHGGAFGKTRDSHFMARVGKGPRADLDLGVRGKDGMSQVMESFKLIGQTSSGIANP